jgi:hypothetical protein
MEGYFNLNSGKTFSHFPLGCKQRLLLLYFSVITYPHPNPLPKGEGIRNRSQILPLKTLNFPALSPLSHRDVCPEGVEGLGVRDGRQLHFSKLLRVHCKKPRF